MPKALKPTKLLFGVKTAKRRTLPKEYHVSITLEADKADLFFDYVASEIKKIEEVVRIHNYPPGYVIPAGETLLRQPQDSSCCVSESSTSTCSQTSNPQE
jgi:hypothetical protein